MKFMVEPLKGIIIVRPMHEVKRIELGMTAEMVGQRMSGELEIGDIRATSKDHPTYYYPEEPVFFYFDESGHLDGIEFCSGADVLIGGVNLLELPVRRALDALIKLDPDTVVDDEGATSHRLSLAIWCPNLDDEEDEEPVESFLIAVPGYFDFLKSGDNESNRNAVR